MKTHDNPTPEEMLKYARAVLFANYDEEISDKQALAELRGLLFGDIASTVLGEEVDP